MYGKELFEQEISNQDYSVVKILTKISSKASEESLRDLCFFLRNPARIGNESARIGLRLIFNGELAIRIKAFTAVKRVISFFSLDKERKTESQTAKYSRHSVTIHVQ